MPFRRPLRHSTAAPAGAHRIACGLASAFAVVVGLTGCVTRQPAPRVEAHGPAAQLLPSPLRGQRYDVVTTQSRLVVLAYRAGPLAALGHDHVIACRCLTGTVYLPRDPLHASFDVRIPLRQLTVDDPALRAAQRSADFPPDVPPSARQGTRRHMLGAALLNAARFPDITLRSAGLRPSPDGKQGDILVLVRAQIAGRSRSLEIPMHYEIRSGEIVATGAFPLRQTDLGLTPYGVLGGALRVKDRMQVRLTLLARRRG